MAFYPDDNRELNSNYISLSQSKKEAHAEWVGIPVNGTWRYRCGNIDCCRLIPFGCEPHELNYCPYCGTKMHK